LNAAALIERFGPDAVGGTAMVQRFVDAQDERYRGYDIEVLSSVVGLDASEQVMFVLSDSRSTSIQLGAEVLFAGVRGSQPAEIIEAGCPVLVPLGR
jgi:hypothetical protein